MSTREILHRLAGFSHQERTSRSSWQKAILRKLKGASAGLAALALFAAARPAGAALVGLWQLNEGTGGIIYDSSGNGLTGYLTNNTAGKNTLPLWSTNASPLGAADGMVAPGNNALYFPASQFNNSAQVNDTPLLDPVNAITLAVDFNADNFTNEGVLISKHAGGTSGSYMLSIPSANGPFSFTIINASSVRSNLMWNIPTNETGQYHQLAGTYDSATGIMKLYHDGVLVASNVQSGKIKVYSPAPLMFGDYSSAVTPWEYQGYIDNPAVFNTALSDGGVAVGQPAAPGSGIYQLFNQGAVSFVSPVVFTNQPASQAVALGATAAFSAGVSGGVPPITYQWQINGTNIGGATNSLLTITNAQLTNSGTYTAIATDASISLTVTSTPALLLVGTVGHTLVGLWQLNEGTGQIVHDSSGNGLNGYLTNIANSSLEPVWSTNGSPLGAADGLVAPGNNALYFPAGQFNNSAQVSDTPLLDPTNALTLAVDFNPDNFDQGVFVSKHSGSANGSYMLSITNGTSYSFMVINSSAVRVNLLWPIPPGDAGGYHQLIGTYDGITMRLYHDGVLEATGGQSGGIQVVTASLMFGDYNDAIAGWEYQGYIDNPALFSTALSDGGVAVGQAAAPGSDIYTLFQQGAAAFAPAQITVALTAPNTLVLNWVGTNILESAPGIAGPWTPVTTNVGPYTVNPAAQSQQFFRCLNVQQ